MAYFREVQYFRQPWIVALLLLVMAPISYGIVEQLILGNPWGSRPMSDKGLILFGVFTLLFIVWLLNVHLVTEVRESELLVHFVWLWKPRHIPFQDIQGAEAVVYRPIREYGGWGIRRGRKGWAYNVSGNRGVELRIVNGRHFLIGSQRAEELAEAVRQRMTAS